MSPLPVDLGEGARLRRLVLDDAEALYRTADAERERLGRWLPWVEPMDSVEHERRWLAGALADERDLTASGIFVADEVVGGAGLTPYPLSGTGEIGYWIRRAFEGRGLVTMSVRGLVDVGFGELGLHRITIRAGVDNARSRAIPERLGFTLEGVLRGEGKGSGGFYDLAVYGLLEDEWTPR